MYNENLLLHELTACLTVKDANAPESYLLTNTRDIGFRCWYHLEHRGWTLPLINVRTGKFIYFVDNGKYRDPFRMMLKAGYLPIFDSSDILNGFLFRYSGDVNYFLDVHFPSWIDEKRKYAAKIETMANKYSHCCTFMPFIKDKDGRYLAVGITRQAKREFVLLPKGFKQYYPPMEADTVILPPSLEMAAKLGLPVNPADWLVPNPEDEWICRPVHKPIDCVPETLRRDYKALIGNINNNLKNPPRWNKSETMYRLRLAERRLIGFEIQAIRGADDEDLSMLLAKCEKIYRG